MIMLRSFTTSALILKRFNYGEADRILTLFTDKYGKLTVIAKGVRKPSSRKRGHIELFNHIRAHIVHGRTWDIITEAETINNFNQLRTRSWQLETIFSAYHFAELIDRLLPEHEPHLEIFELLTKSFQSLPLIVNSQQLIAIDRYFKHRLIRLLGFWPHDRTVPRDINAYINTLLEKPLKTDQLVYGLF